jgi:hypothetical protein
MRRLWAVAGGFGRTGTVDASTGVWDSVQPCPADCLSASLALPKSTSFDSLKRRGDLGREPFFVGDYPEFNFDRTAVHDVFGRGHRATWHVGLVNPHEFPLVVGETDVQSAGQFFQ